MAAFFISAFVAWLIADNWVPTNRVLHWLLISYAVLSIVIMGAVSSPDWPEPADRPWTEREDAQIESGILAPIRSEG
jgi:hypothetical protein